MSLVIVLAKVFNGVLDERLSRYIKLHDNQFGFRSSVSAESAVLGLKHTVHYYTKRKPDVYACFLDLSKAFGLVSCVSLWNKLKVAQVPPEIINILKYWYGDQVNQVRRGGALSKPYGLECGVRRVDLARAL